MEKVKKEKVEKKSLDKVQELNGFSARDL